MRGLLRYSMRAIAACAALIAVAPASADTTKRSSDWTLTLGVEGRVLPEFDGSRNETIRPVPIFRLRRAGTPEQFRSPRDGGGVAIIDTWGVKVGPSFKAKLPRRENDAPELRGLGDIGWAFEAGGFAEFWPAEWLRTRAELRQGFGGHKGLVGELSSDVVLPLSERLTFSAGPRMSWGNAAATSPYFSITSAQSVASGLPVYSAGAGIRSYGAGLQVSYKITPRWRSHWFLEYERLAGDAADSPLVTQRGNLNQIQVGIGVTRSFDFPGLW